MYTESDLNNNTVNNTLNNAVIDFELGARLAGNRHELAKELLFFLVKNLPNDLLQIQQAHACGNIQQLKTLTHKLHGAISYCGAPRLKNVLVKLNVALKKNEASRLDSILADLTAEATQLIQKVSEMR